jgi:hypothetical protein
MNDSRPRNNNGQFAPDEMSGVDANTTSAAYNPQIIEARKAALAEKLRRAVGIRRGVEESVPRIDSNVVNERIRGAGGGVLFNHGGHGEHGGVKEFSKSAALLDHQAKLAEALAWGANWRKTKGSFLIVREGGPAGVARQPVGKATTFGGARRAIDRHDLKYGAVAHHLIDPATGKRPVGFSAKLRLRELAAATLIDKPLLKEDEKLLRDGAAKRALIGSSLPGALGAGAGALYGSVLHSVLTDGRIDSQIGKQFPRLLKHAKSSSKGKYALIGAAAGAIPAIISYPMGYAGMNARREGLKKYPKSVGELGPPGYTGSYPENSALSTLKAYFRKKEMSAKFFGRMEDEDTALKKAGRVAGTAAIGGLAGRMAVWNPVHGGKMNRATMIGAGLGALSQGAFEHIASAKTGLHGKPVNVTDESRKSTRDIGRALPSLGLAAAGTAAYIAAKKDESDDFVNDFRIRVTGKASDQYAAKKHAQARRAMGLEGETFIPQMPNFSLPFGPKSANPRSVDEIGGGLEQKLERLAKSAKGTPEGEAAARKLNALRSKEGKTFMGKVKKAVAKVSSKFKSGNVAPQKVIARLLSAKLRLRELARQAAYDPYAVQAQPAEPGQAGRDFRNAALGIGALGAGGGVAYAGFRGAQAAKSAQVLTDDALKTSGEARKAARSARVAAARVNRAGKVIKTQLTTFPTFKKVASKIFEEDLKSLKELADRSVELNSI